MNLNLENAIAEVPAATSKTFSLRELFTGRYFYIPDYQRGYSWEEKQLKDLIEDIDRISNLDHNHYTGTIVAAQDEAGRYELVDGQQRLTTIVILLNQIYLKFPEKFEEIRPLFIQRGFLGEEKLVFTPNAETQKCFEQAIVYNRPFNAEIKSHEAMIFARNHFKHWLDSNEARIEDIYYTICHKLSFLLFCPEKKKDIGIMFEVINNRGKQLSELEKIKNYFIYYSTVHGKETLRHDINREWATIQFNLSQAARTSNDDENIFLRNCFLVFFRSSKDRSWVVYEECKQEFNIDNSADDFINASVAKMRYFVSFLASASCHYAWFYNQKYFISTYHGVFKNELDKSLTYLRCQHVNASIMPLYLAVMSQIGLTEQVIEVLALIEKLNMRLYVLPSILGRADSKQAELFHYANLLYSNSNIPITGESTDYFEEFKKQLIKITLENCDQETFVNSFQLQGDDSYDFYRWRGLRYLLACYEEDILKKRAKRTFDIQRILSGKKAVGDNYNDQLSLEHIWAAKNRHDDFDTSYKTKRRLGNFVLCGISSNISLSDNDITDKVAELQKHNSVGEGALDMLQVAELNKILDTVLADVNSKYHKKTKNYWRDIADGICKNREKSLINFALERWKLPTEKKYKWEDDVTN